MSGRKGCVELQTIENKNSLCILLISPMLCHTTVYTKQEVKIIAVIMNMCKTLTRLLCVCVNQYVSAHFLPQALKDIRKVLVLALLTTLLTLPHQFINGFRNVP